MAGGKAVDPRSEEKTLGFPSGSTLISKAA